MHEVDATVAYDADERAGNFRLTASLGALGSLYDRDRGSMNAIHHGPWFGENYDVMSKISHCTGELHGVQLRSANLHGMRINKNSHVVRSAPNILTQNRPGPWSDAASSGAFRRATPVS